MSKIILAINAGSSSVKVSVFTAAGSDAEPKQLADIQIAGLTAPPATLKYERGHSHSEEKKLDKIDGPEDAFERILKHLTADADLKELQHADDVDFACHRIVHGGDYEKPTRIDEDTYHHLEELSDLAPLHNAGALSIVQAVHKHVPKCTNVAFFDSMFHQTMSTPTKTYVIDQEKANKNKLRKYGFHGLSYAYITRRVAKFLNKDPARLNIIALHLGSGCSACCIKNGKSWDTTMGLTPVSGLPGATRCGDIDPSLIFHYTHDAGRLSRSSTNDLHITSAEEILNKQSGWKAITGTTDFGAISSKAEQGDEACKLAFDILVDRILGYIGSYYVKLGGEVDALVFAGGVGEKGVQLRHAVVERLHSLGFKLDEGHNAKPSNQPVADIGAYGYKHKVLICQTDEQSEMARECMQEADRLRESQKDLPIR